MENFSSLSLRSCKYLNDDILANILSFLPAKSVLKIKLLCRRIYHLISEEFFVLLQARHAETVDSGFFAAYKYGANICFVDEWAGIPDDAFKFLCFTARILSSTNGLIFYFDRNMTVPNISVYNPVRRTSLSIPLPTDRKLSHDHHVGIGAVVSKDFDYKIVYVRPGPEWNDNMHCKIYDSRDGEWKVDALVDGGRRNLRLEEPVVCGSTVFWASTCGPSMPGVDPYVVAVDVDAAAAAQRSRIVPLPADAVAAGSPDMNEIRIARWPRSGLLCLIQYRKVTSVFALWLFKTNEEDAAAWKKICEVRVEEVVRHELQVGSFKLINCDMLVFITVCCQLYSYSLSSRQLKKLGSVNSPYSALIPYANTLRPCGRDNNA